MVTGASDGLGLATTAALTDAGARVVMACRSGDKGERARRGLRRSSAAGVALVDLSDLASVLAFAERILDAEPQLDLLINNAGVMTPPAALSPDGVELQWATNHLGHFALTGLLHELLLATPGSRIVAVSSLAATSGDLDRSDPTSLDGYRRMARYADSKLANLVFAVELDRRLRRRPASTIAVAAHPGITHTNLTSGVGLRWLTPALKTVSKLTTQPVAVGALPILRAAVDPEISGGTYIGPAGRDQRRGHPVEVPIPPKAADPEAGSRLWRRSVELCGIDWLAD